MTIKNVWVVVADDGIPVVETGIGMMPLLTTDIDRLDEMKTLATRFARALGLRLEIREYTHYNIAGEIDGRENA